MTTTDDLRAATDAALATERSTADAQAKLAVDTITELQEALAEATKPPVAPAPPAVPVPPVVTEPAGWTLFRDIDFSKDEGWTHNLGNQGRDASICRASQAKFGTGAAGKSLTVTMERANSTAPIYSVDMKFLKLGLPLRSFKAEVGYQISPMAAGLWPAPMWFRDTPGGILELDNAEFWGKELDKAQAHFTMIWVPKGSYDDKTVKNTKVPMSGYGDPTNEQRHTMGVEKTLRKLEFFIDGKSAAVLTPASTGVTTTFWDATWEQDLILYPRVTGQVGIGPKGSSAGPVDPTWLKSTMVIDHMKFWTPSK